MVKRAGEGRGEERKRKMGGKQELDPGKPMAVEFEICPASPGEPFSAFQHQRGREDARRAGIQVRTSLDTGRRAVAGVQLRAAAGGLN